MPYQDERAGLASILAIAESGVVEQFRRNLVERHDGTLLPLPEFVPIPRGRARKQVVAIDGSNVYDSIPGALPCTEAGFVSLGVVLVDTKKLFSLQRLRLSHAVNPRELRDTEKGKVLGTMLPGRNAARSDGVSPQDWFRKTIDKEIRETQLGDENFAETLSALLGDCRKIKCPAEGCSREDIIVTGPSAVSQCPDCGEPILLTDGLRIHEQFEEHKPAKECHSRFRDTLEILALMNILRYLVKTKQGRDAIANTAFVMDGPLAAFGTIAVLAKAIRDELQSIQESLYEDKIDLLIISGIKTGPFVEHFEQLDRAPEPNHRVKTRHYYLPSNIYIRKNIVASSSNNPKPWGELTYFGRPIFFKTDGNQRLVLNIAQPEADPPLTEAPPPQALADALATADQLGVGAHQFQPLRRVHAQAAIPLRIGTDLIRSLSPVVHD